nr:MAG TPA: hypothetical protein [Bacteriophage sp.]
MVSLIIILPFCTYIMNNYKNKSPIKKYIKSTRANKRVK